MALVCTTKNVTTNYAQFKDNETDGHDQGEMTWDAPFEEDNNFFVTCEGTDVEGNVIDPTTFDSGVEYTTEPIDPGKVVKWLLDKLGEVICPTCGLP
jgi:hypothetical protein